MWNWFTPKCPIKLRDKVWVEQRTRWLIREFGRNPLVTSPTILPTPEFFPDIYHGTPDDVVPMLRRVCQYMECDFDRFRLMLYDGDKPAFDEDGQLLSGAAGIYVPADGAKRPMIRVNTNNLKDPLALVTTLAHEVAHDRLLGESRVSMEEPDHEHLTDLTVVFFGLGVFPASTAFRFTAWSTGTYSAWQYATLGYLKDDVLGYALALRSWLRDESAMAWASHLPTTPKSTYRSGLRYLQKTGDCIASRIEMLNGSVPRTVSVDELQGSSDGLRLAAIQRLWEHQSPSAEHIEAIVDCLQHPCDAIRAEAIGWLHTVPSLSATAVGRLMELLQQGDGSVSVQAAVLLGEKCNATDETTDAKRLLQAIVGLAGRVKGQELLHLAPTLGKCGPKADRALPPLLDELRARLIAHGTPATELIEHLQRIDPNLDERVSRHWPETIVNLYHVAAKEVRRSRRRDSRKSTDHRV